MTTYAERTEQLVRDANDVTAKAREIALLSAKIQLAIALADTGLSHSIGTITLDRVAFEGNEPGEYTSLSMVVSAEGEPQSAFDELFEAVDAHVLQAGPGYPADLIDGSSETFGVQPLISALPQMSDDLDAALRALRSS